MRAPRLHGQTIALCMIVRNEAHILERCLRSVDGLINTWVICDTGSTDGTLGLIRSSLSHLDGELHSRPWVDFGHNRSELLTLARGSADYLLLLDADQAVRLDGALPKLTADAYLLRETGSLDFGVIRLVRGDRRWWYEGSTHEYIATDGELLQEELPELRIEHHADGDARPHKLLRDAGLLKRDMLRDPGNPRPVFYLAQTYRDLGRHELAASYYRRRVEMGGWEEEVFYANLQEGTLRIARDFASGVPVLLEAWGRRPARAEPLYELAQAYRQRGDFALAQMFAARGLELPYPADVLFIHRWVYDYGLLIEHALAAGGLGDIDRARADLQTVLDFADLPRDTHRQVEAWLRELAEPTPERGMLRDARASAPDEGDGPRFDVRPPAGAVARSAPGPTRLAELAPSMRVGEVKLDVKPAWPAFNPSIAPDGDGFRMIVRTANYQIERGVLHPDGVLHNINYMVSLDSGLAVTAIEPIEDHAPRAELHESRIAGYEDCRLIELADGWYASATVCDMNAVERREIALLAFDGPAIVRARPLAGPEPGRHEKNWMPFTIDGELHFLYSSHPTIVLSCDPRSGQTAVRAHSDAPFADGFRGGSQGVALAEGEGHLFVIHETARDGRALRYLHRFLLLGTDLRLAGVSPRFTFTGDTVEFCAGMSLHGPDELVMSFGISDAAAGLAVASLQDALALVEPAEAYLSAR